MLRGHRRHHATHQALAQSGHAAGRGLGLLLAGPAFLFLLRLPELWPIAVPCVLSGLLLIAGNVHLILRRPPRLRATRAGLWFGGGAIIPWRMVTEISDATLPGYRNSVCIPELSIAFRDRTALRGLPWRLWFTAALPCRIAIRLTNVEMVPACVVSSLEAMRALADSDEASVVEPSARAARRARHRTLPGAAVSRSRMNAPTVSASPMALLAPLRALQAYALRRADVRS
ncbi:MAG TPA: hypothetical protein VHW23_11345 [Kofleriaceae bacterium]|jgi:hypothetical protein|nr:hypothetical protein [Kofleriaceae bacterium]